MKTPTHRSVKASLPLAALLALASCGVIPTPPVALPDATIPLGNTALSMGQVVYMDRDVLGGSTLAAALQGLSISGNATYAATGGTLSSLKVYVRSSLRDLGSSCTALPVVPPAYACSPANEAAQAIGTVSVQAGASRAFTLSGPALDAAARTGHGYFGVQVTGGQALQGESLSLTSLKAQAKF
ncbi:hypothetical protein [Deinococcus koreensis]|uniref:Uncharacterized protein n=1 Tax=Deinococcus koreensis TaxID=2054903 RepID=A0A2K3UU17_9DEIO|nr:hypothetical protein [Deinococcus koreensis]PNY80035.1 hypothetical protein CVO96_00510 [Deinococcus koreensis]